MTASASEVYCLKSVKFSRFDGFSQLFPAFITNVVIQNKYPYLPYLKALDNNGLSGKTYSLTIFRLGMTLHFTFVA